MKDTSELIKKAWTDFTEHGILESDVIKKDVADSWKICKSAGVDPLGGAGAVLDKTALKKRLKENENLIKIAHPIMEQIYNQVRGSGFVIVLTDKDGYLIDRIGDEGIMGEARKMNFVEGALWTENAVGTNAIGMALRLDKPIQLVGAEHYCITHQTGTCSAAPIHDENGQLIGCLNMTGLKEAAHPHTLGIVLAGAYSIEKQLALIRSNQIIDTAFNSINEGILITDGKLNLILANKSALKILGIEQDQIFRIPIVSLIQNHESVDEIMTSLKPIFDAECTFCTGSKTVRTTANFVPILDTSGISGLVVTFKEEKYVHRFVNKIAGYRANYIFEDIIAVNPNMKKVIESARKASITDCNILITGESGTGKELFAQAIHNNSKRAKGPFVAVNCASLPKDLVESELFGYEKGAFTGANKEGHPGKFELADGGTIFLDEIGELPIEIQPKLLRVLDNHKISRVGSTHERQVDVRVLAATNKNLRKEVDNKNFRDDLYYRLNVINITIPPLRNRMEDVRVLANVFLSRLNKANPGNHKEFDKNFITKLERYYWPGNVRELQNVIERAYYLTDGKLITEEYLPENISIGLKNEDPRLKDNIIPLKIIEERSIKNTLAASGGDILKTAEMLNLSRATIYRKIKKYNIDVNSYKNQS